MSNICACFKCGKVTQTQQHHYKGYAVDETKPYCKSCDLAAHRNARKTGKCILTHEEASKLSISSANKAHKWKSIFNYTPEKRVLVRERIVYNIRSNHLTYNTWWTLNK